MIEFIFYYSILAVFAGIAHLILLANQPKFGLITKWIINSNVLNCFGKILLVLLYLVISPISVIIETLIMLCTIKVKKEVKHDSN